ncbi:hypothetical protein M0Q97_06665 [Candidatus Dojkabacteria bacterium]|jgi:hypothetical protein|nr:hypothetical protein [Candidatus Dojkabacteria bacterium]
MKKSENINRVLQYTQCLDIWLVDKGEHKILEEYDDYVKSIIIEKHYNQIKTLSEWLSDTNSKLFSEYDQYMEKNIIG